MNELNLILQSSDSLHMALVTQNEDQIEISLRDVIVQIERTRRFTNHAKEHERIHLLRILQAAQEQFELSIGENGAQKELHLQQGLNQIVNMARMYNTDPRYAIFFCEHDKTTWIQKGSRAEDPFRSPASSKTCGIKVSR